MARVSAVIVVALGAAVATCPLSADARRVLADPEGASLTGITSYLAYVTKGCGDPAAAQGECLQLKGSFCGARDTSEVLCRAGKDATAQFRSSSRYTRVGYLRCSLSKPLCTTDPEGADRDASRAAVDPRSLAAWYEYANKCAASAPAKAPAATCYSLSGDLCSRPDVKCSKNRADFLDVSNPKAKRAVLRSDDDRGLVFFAPQQAQQAGAAAQKGGKAAQQGSKAAARGGSG